VLLLEVHPQLVQVGKIVLLWDSHQSAVVLVLVVTALPPVVVVVVLEVVQAATVLHF
jgi:hypothetical protein